MRVLADRFIDLPLEEKDKLSYLLEKKYPNLLLKDIRNPNSVEYEYFEQAAYGLFSDGSPPKSAGIKTAEQALDMINNDLAERYTDKINSLAKTSSKISTDNTAKIKSISSEIETLETKRKEIGEGIKIEKNNKFYEYIMQTSPKEVATLAIDFESQGFSFLTDLLKDPKLKFQVPVEGLKKISEIDKEIDRRKQSKLTFIEQVKDTVSLVKKDRRKHFKEAMVHLVNTTSKDPNKRERDIRNIEEKMDAPKSIKAAVKEKFSARQR